MPDENEYSPVDPQPSDQSNRRDFLSGKGAIKAIRSGAIDKLELPAGVVNAAQSLERQSAYIEQYSKNAMACEFELLFNLHQYPQSSAAAMMAFELIDKIEDQMTVYRDHSEVSQLNRTAASAPVKLEQNLFDVLTLAQQIHKETGGAFDITSSALTKLWGFDRRSGKLPAQHEIDQALKSVGAENIKLDSENVTVEFDTTLEINLGGIGKGHALDRVAELFAGNQVNDFVIHGGQSSVSARGNSVTQKNPANSSEPANSSPATSDAGWAVGVTHPTLPGVRLGEVILKDQSLGTSGTGRQGFFHKGKRYGHIIDPRTGWPASHFLSTTVVSQSAALSDALATAFFVMPIDKVETYCSNHPNVAAILVLAGAKNRSNTASTGHVEIVSFNMTDQQWKTH